MEKSKLEKLELDIKRGLIVAIASVCFGIYFYFDSGKTKSTTELFILLNILFAYSLYTKERYSITVCLAYFILDKIFTAISTGKFTPMLGILIWGFFYIKACWAIFQYYKITNIEPTKSRVSKMSKILITLVVILFILSWLALFWEKELNTFLE